MRRWRVGADRRQQRWRQSTPSHRLFLPLAVLLFSCFSWWCLLLLPPPSSATHRPPPMLRRLLRPRHQLPSILNHHQQQHQHRGLHLPLTMASSTTSNTPPNSEAAAAAEEEIAALRQATLEGLRRRLRPVPHLDTDARRFAESREAFRAYALGRFDLASLAAQGEESSVRRAVHAHLLAEADGEYRRLVEVELPGLEDPWATNINTYPLFRPDPARLTSASQRDAYLPAARSGLAAVEKAMTQLSVGVDKARERLQSAAAASDEDAEAAAASRAALAEREARLGEMAAKRARFEALLAAVERVEARLGAARAAVLARLERRARAGFAGSGSGGAGGGGGGASMAPPPPPPPRDTTAWGKQAEREARAALEAVLAEVNAAFGAGDGPPLRLLASVLLKALDGPEMAGVRAAALAAGGEGLYAGDVGRPKGEIDLLVVRPHPADPATLQVVLAIEVKRSLDEVAVDCLKLHLLLDMCTRIGRDNPNPTRQQLRFACGRGGGKSGKPGPSTEGGYALDFSALGPPAAAAVYVAKRGGPTLRAVSKLMLEVVQLVKPAPPPPPPSLTVGEGGGEGEAEAERRMRERLQAFYAPDFVEEDGNSGSPSAMAAAEAAREGVVDELWERFRSSGVDRLEARLGRVARALTGAEGGPGSVGLSTVFTLGEEGGGSV